jgi:hypothetical protein
MIYRSPPQAKPTHEQPGSLAEQLAAVGLSLYLADRRASTAAVEWQDARALAIPHARPTIAVSDPPSDPRCSDPGRDDR